MSWGYRILIVYLAFAGLMGYMTYRAFQVNVDLVENDYYKTELKYQQVIDASKNSSRLSTAVSLHVVGGQVDIRLPAEMKHSDVKGTAWFYCAYDASKDRHFDLKIDQDALQQISLREFSPGHYVVKLDWTSGNRSYYTEQPFTVL